MPPVVVEYFCSEAVNGFGQTRRFVSSFYNRHLARNQNQNWMTHTYLFCCVINRWCLYDSVNLQYEWVCTWWFFVSFLLFKVIIKYLLTWLIVAGPDCYSSLVSRLVGCTEYWYLLVGMTARWFVRWFVARSLLIRRACYCRKRGKTTIHKCGVASQFLFRYRPVLN